MRDKAIFAGISIVLSLALFALVSQLKAIQFYTPWDVSAVLAAVAVMVAALGVSWKRKAVAVLATLVGYTAFDLLGSLVRVALTGGGTPSAAGGMSLMAFSWLYSLIPPLYPLAALVVFVGRDPSVLWTRHRLPVSKRRVKRR